EKEIIWMASAASPAGAASSESQGQELFHLFPEAFAVVLSARHALLRLAASDPTNPNQQRDSLSHLNAMRRVFEACPPRLRSLPMYTTMLSANYHAGDYVGGDAVWNQALAEGIRPDNVMKQARSVSAKARKFDSVFGGGQKLAAAVNKQSEEQQQVV